MLIFVQMMLGRAMLVDGFDRDLAPNIDSYMFGGQSQSDDPLTDQLVKSQVKAVPQYLYVVFNF